VLSTDGRVVAEAKSVLVGYDYGAGRPVPLTHDLRRRLAA
jgi:acyl-CoA thioesterase FadM